jgi:nitrate/nitrite transporter NarK
VYALQVLPSKVAEWSRYKLGIDISGAAEMASRWQTPFFVFGGLGVIWAVVWYLWFRDDPAQHAWVKPEELAEIGPPVASAGHHGVPWARLFASPQLWLIIGMYWFYVFGFIFFMFWLPKYLRDGRELSAGATTICVSLTFASGAIGNAVGGFASDFLTRHYGLAIGRKLIGVTSLALCSLLMAAAALSPNKWVTAVTLIACFGITDGMLPCSWAICLDVGRKYAGAVSGAMNSAGQAAGAISTVLFGYALTWFGGNYNWPLLLLAPSLLISAVFFALIDPTRPIVAEPSVDTRLPEEPVCV